MTPTMTQIMMVSSESTSTETRQRRATRQTMRAAQTKPSTYATPYQRMTRGPMESATGSML